MQHTLIQKIEAYCKSADIAESTFGNLVAKDSRLVSRVRRGKITLTMMERIEAWLVDHKRKKVA